MGVSLGVFSCNADPVRIKARCIFDRTCGLQWLSNNTFPSMRNLSNSGLVFRSVKERLRNTSVFCSVKVDFASPRPRNFWRTLSGVGGVVCLWKKTEGRPQSDGSQDLRQGCGGRETRMALGTEWYFSFGGKFRW